MEVKQAVSFLNLLDLLGYKCLPAENLLELENLKIKHVFLLHVPNSFREKIFFPPPIIKGNI